MNPLPPTNVRWLIVLMLMGFTFLGHFNRVSISVVGTERFIAREKLSEVAAAGVGGPSIATLQFIDREKMSAEDMGLVYTAFLLVYTIGMLPGGWVIDRLGPGDWRAR